MQEAAEQYRSTLSIRPEHGMKPSLPVYRGGQESQVARPLMGLYRRLAQLRVALRSQGPQAQKRALQASELTLRDSRDLQK